MSPEKVAKESAVAAGTEESSMSAFTNNSADPLLIEEPSTIEATTAMSAKAYTEKNVCMFIWVSLAVLLTIYLLSFVDVMVVGTDNEHLRNSLKLIFDWSVWLCGYCSVLLTLPVLPLVAIGFVNDEFSSPDDNNSSRNSTPAPPSGTTGSDDLSMNGYQESGVACGCFSFLLGFLWGINKLFLMWWRARYGETAY